MQTILSHQVITKSLLQQSITMHTIWSIKSNHWMNFTYCYWNNQLQSLLSSIKYNEHYSNHLTYSYNISHTTDSAKILHLMTMFYQQIVQNTYAFLNQTWSFNNFNQLFQAFYIVALSNISRFLIFIISCLGNIFIQCIVFMHILSQHIKL